MKTLALATAALFLLVAAPTGAADDDCDKSGDVCVEAGKTGACAMTWSVYHPLGACVSTDPSVTVCTWTPPCRTV